MGEAVLPLGLKLLVGQAVVFGAQAVHRVGVGIIQQPFARQEVPHHHHNGGDQLAHVGANQIFGALRDECIVVHAVSGDPDDRVVHQQTDDGADDENHNFHPAGHILAVLEHHLHAGHIVENQRNDEGNSRGNNVMHVKYADKEVQNTPVDDEGDNAHDAEFHKLRDKFSHRWYSTP